MAILSKSCNSFAVIFSIILSCILVIVSFNNNNNRLITQVQGCGFTQDLQEQMAADLKKDAPANLAIHPERAASYAPIRIVVSSLDLDDSTKYCTAAGESRPDMKGGSLTCTADDVFTDAMRTELRNVIIPRAVEMLKESFSVATLSSNIIVSGATACNNFNIPSAHKTTGVADADFVLYVAAAPTATGNVAWAATCQSTTDAAETDKRPIVGRANFGPYYLSRKHMPLDDIIKTGVHELLHALGYNYNKFSATPSMTSSLTFRGATKNAITSSRALERAREWTGCGSLPGVELENEGGSGTADSHPDRRIYKDDIMAGASGDALSVITLAVMEDLGSLYKVNYTNARNMITSRGLGCDYVNGDCTTTAGGLGREWCSGTAAACTSNLKGIGTCSDPFLTDSCRYINPYSNRKCYDGSQTDSTDTGDTFHANSRCFNTKNTFRSTGSSVVPGSNFRCLKAQCFAGILSFTIGRDSVAFKVCKDGEEPTYDGFDGNVVCGNITYMCESLNQWDNVSAISDPMVAVKTVTYGKSNRATDWVYTTKLTLTISGSAWDKTIKSDYSELFVAMQGDVAQILSLESQQVWVTSVVAAGTDVTFVVNINAPSLSTTAAQGFFQAYLGRRSWMPRTAKLYSSTTGNSDQYAVLGAAGASDKPENYCTPYMPSFESTTKCNGLIAGLVIAAVAFLAVWIAVIYYCCCKYVDPPGYNPETGKTVTMVPDGRGDRRVKYEARVDRRPHSKR